MKLALSTRKVWQKVGAGGKNDNVMTPLGRKAFGGVDPFAWGVSGHLKYTWNLGSIVQ